MIRKIFSIRDSKGELFNDPFYAHSHGEAERNFTALARDEKTTIGQYPEDFDLYFMGELDTDTGKISVLPTPQHILKAINIPPRQ